MTILIEGDDDVRFFNSILKEFFERLYIIILFKYQQIKLEKRCDLIKTCQNRNQDYLYFRDIDNSPCVTKRKDEIEGEFNRFNENIDKNKIIIVIKIMEGWYLAGLTEAGKKKLRIKKDFSSTNAMKKSDFNELIPKGMTRTEFLIEILENYDIRLARTKNASFHYFFTKFIERNPLITVSPVPI